MSSYVGLNALLDELKLIGDRQLFVGDSRLADMHVPNRDPFGHQPVREKVDWIVACMPALTGGATYEADRRHDPAGYMFRKSSSRRRRE
jgi:hypothetical protein